MSDICKCGHPMFMHVGFLNQWLGEKSCTGQRDTRHATAGGDTLSPCDCKGFVAVDVFADAGDVIPSPTMAAQRWSTDDGKIGWMLNDGAGWRIPSAAEFEMLERLFDPHEQL